MSDFDFANHGSICLLTPLTPAAHDWCNEHLSDDAMHWGQASIVIEPRYVADIIEGILEEGMTIQ